MRAMFDGASAFNQLLNFDTSSVTTMERMFHYASAFNQPLRFDTSKVEDMHLMFLGASSLSAVNRLSIRCAWANSCVDTSAFGLAGYCSTDWVSGDTTNCPSPPLAPPPPPPPSPSPPQPSTCNCSATKAELEAKLDDMEERLANEKKL
eukprot:scaffold48818_cov29-Phaeocystis_antarctica.AAC.1